jgi:hypothetical protein
MLGGVINSRRLECGIMYGVSRGVCRIQPRFVWSSLVIGNGALGSLIGRLYCPEWSLIWLELSFGSGEAIDRLARECFQRTFDHSDCMLSSAE